MVKKSKFKPTQVSEGSARIPAPKIDRNQKVFFSFEKLVEKNGKFEYKNREKNYFLSFVERLRVASGMTRDEMRLATTLRHHPTDFSKGSVTEPGFGLQPELDQDAWQFSLTANEHGRVHGYYVGSTFFVVWLDPDHKLDPGSRPC